MKLRMPPPELYAVFSKITQFVNVASECPIISIPPPSTAKLLAKTQFIKSGLQNEKTKSPATDFVSDPACLDVACHSLGDGGAKSGSGGDTDCGCIMSGRCGCGREMRG